MSFLPSDPNTEAHRDLPERTSLDITLLTSVEEFRALAKEWNELVQQSASPNVFRTWEWIWTWWEAFGAGLCPWILVARDGPGERLVGVAPFVQGKPLLCPLRCRQLALLGTTEAAGDHLDIVTHAGYEEVVAGRFAELLATQGGRWDLLRFDRMASESRLVQLLRERTVRPAMIWASICPFVRLTDRWDDFLMTLGRNWRRSVRRIAKRLQEEFPGAVEYQRASSVDEVLAAVEELFRLHQEVRATRGERGAVHDPAVRGFHRRIAERFFQKDWLRLYLLKVHGRAIAAAYCFHYGDTVSYFMTGYDQAWAHYSPGAAITTHAIRSAIEEGAREFDFLRGTEEYKSRWTDAVRRDLRMYLATTIKGSALVGVYRLLYAARQSYRNWCRDSRTIASGSDEALSQAESELTA
jgi:CelD/BcsL family acetyltransferase involved in cellulose biosynthesis